MERIKNFFLKNTSTKQTVIKNTVWLFVSEIGVRLLKLVLFIYAARKLGTSEWGIFSYSLAIMAIFAVISDIGINSIILRETSKKTENIKEYIATSFFIKFGLSIVSSLALLSLLFFIKDTNTVRVLLPITAFMLFFDSMREFGFAINRAFEKMEVEAFTKISTTILLVVLGFIFLSRHTRAISVSYAYLISTIIGFVIMYYSLRSHFKDLKSNFNKKIISYIIKEAWLIAIVGVIGTIMSSIDMVILGWFTDSSHIGLYSAAQKPIQIIYIVPALLSTAIFPLFSRLALTEKDKLKNIVKKSLKFSILIAIFINIGIFAIGGPVFKFMFGQQYIESIPIFKIMALAIITGAPSMIISNAIFAVGEQKKLIQFVSISLSLNIAMCLLLIPRFGMYGAAISVTLAQTLGNLFLIVKSMKVFNELGLNTLK